MDFITILAQALPATNPTLSVTSWHDGIYPFFAEHLRDNFFNGFLAAGSFLLAAKTFIVITMKQQVYDTNQYEKRFKQRQALNKNLERYGPLRRLSWHLWMATVACLVASFAQLSLGLIPVWWIAAICILLAAGAAGLLLVVLFFIQTNLRSLFEFLEEPPPEEE